jgi:hypothetical protein
MSIGLIHTQIPMSLPAVSGFITTLEEGVLAHYRYTSPTGCIAVEIVCICSSTGTVRPRGNCTVALGGRAAHVGTAPQVPAERPPR